MEDSKVEIYETQDYPKTIDEINEEIEPKFFTSNVGIDTRPNELTVSEIFENLNEITQKTKKVSYISEKRAFMGKTERLQLYEAELQSIKQEFSNSVGMDMVTQLSLQEEINFLAAKIDELKERHTQVQAQETNKSRGFSKDVSKINSEIDTSQGLLCELNVSTTEESARISRLEESIREMEHALGQWKQNKPVNEFLKELLLKIKFMNTSLLEKIESHAKHLGAELDLLFNAKHELQVTSDISQMINNLHSECHGVINEVYNLPVLLDQMACSSESYSTGLKVFEQLIRLEETTNFLMRETVETSGLLENMKSGMSENLSKLDQNISYLSSKLS
jgi:chromosome segregation ATPase